MSNPLLMRRRQRAKPPLEYSILYTATLCLIAAGAVMVYSASSAESLLDGSGDPSYFLKRYLVYALLGLAAMHAVSRRGLGFVKRATGPLLAAGFVLTVAVMLPGIGVTVNGATRWLGAGPVQFQPSELLKVALVLYGAQLLAARPKRLQTLGGLAKPLLVVVGAACLLLLKQPDMGTALVVCFSTFCLMIAAGARRRDLLVLVGAIALVALIFALLEPYRRARLMSFVDPWKDASGSGFQSVQAMIAMGSGGFFGRGLGESVQKIFYLPEAHTDMILAVIGEELGFVGISGVLFLYGMIAYAGLRAALRCRDAFGKRLAAGLTVLVCGQAAINLAAVMGLAPLTGIPLPFVSYGGSSLIVALAAVGILLNIAVRGGEARARVPDRGRGDRRPRPAVARGGGGAERARSARDVRRVAESHRSAARS
jgi:cell division protein FtsW